MRLVRTIARPMLAGVFIAGGMDVLANPEPRAKLAKPVVDKVAAFVAKYSGQQVSNSPKPASTTTTAGP